MFFLLFQSKEHVPWTSGMNNELLFRVIVLLLLLLFFFFTALQGRLIFVHRRVEAQQSPPNKHGLEEKTIDFSDCTLIRPSLSLSLSLPLCSLKALVSTGGKNVQAACDWWEQRILSLSHLLMPNGWWCPLMINISHTDPTPHAALMCHHAVYTSAALCRTLAVSLSLSLSLAPDSSLTPPLGPSRLSFQALLPRRWPVPGWPSAQGVCVVPATQRAASSAALDLLAAVPPLLWQEQGPQHLPPYHPLPVLHGQCQYSCAGLQLRRQLRKAIIIIGRHIYHHQL